MSYQLVAGPYDTIDVTELAEGEGAVITEDDPTTESGHGTYVCMGGGVAQRILTAEDIMDGWAMCYLKPSQFDAETGQPTLENPNDETIYHTLVDGVWKKWTHSNGTWTEINEGEVTGANLADNSVSENKLVDECVTGSKIADGAIDSSKLSQPLRDSITLVGFPMIEFAIEDDAFSIRFRESKNPSVFTAFVFYKSTSKIGVFHKSADGSSGFDWVKTL